MTFSSVLGGEDDGAGGVTSSLADDGGVGVGMGMAVGVAAAGVPAAERVVCFVEAVAVATAADVPALWGPVVMAGDAFFGAMPSSSLSANTLTSP